MSCNCISRTKKLLTDKMKEKYQDAEIIEPVEFQNKTIILNPSYSDYVLKNPCVGRVRIGKKIRKYEVDMLPKYCPFYGKPLEERDGK